MWDEQVSFLICNKKKRLHFLATGENLKKLVRTISLQRLGNALV